LFRVKNQRFKTFDCQFYLIAIEPGSGFDFNRITHIHNAWQLASKDLDRLIAKRHIKGIKTL